MSSIRRERLLLFASLGVNGLLLLAFLWLLGRTRLQEARLEQPPGRVREPARGRAEFETGARSQPASVVAITDAEQLELARLRNEVTRLRNDLRAATNAPAVPRAMSVTPAPPAEASPAAADVVTLTNAVSATIPLGHALAVGGWVQPGTGKRILGFVTPETSPDTPGSVLVQARLMSVPDVLLDRLGLQGLRAELPPGQPPSFDATQFAALLKAMEQTDGVDVLSMPRVLTQSGRPAQVSVLNGRDGGPATGPSVGITPTLDATGANVRLDVGVELKLPAAKP